MIKCSDLDCYVSSRVSAQEDWKSHWIDGRDEILAVRDLVFFFTAKANAVFFAIINMFCTAFQDSAEPDFVFAWRGFQLSQYGGTKLLMSPISL